MNPNTDLPKWVWDLVIAIQRHEDEHRSQDACLKGVMAAVPRDVRDQADAIAAYVQRAQTDAIAEKAMEMWTSMANSFFPDREANEL